jgi:hypothetical protein
LGYFPLSLRERDIPEQLFCVGLILPQLAREIEKFRVQRGFHAALTLALSRTERAHGSGEVKYAHDHLAA